MEKKAPSTASKVIGMLILRARDRAVLWRLQKMAARLHPNRSARSTAFCVEIVEALRYLPNHEQVAWLGSPS